MEVCEEIGTWVEENIIQEVEKWVEEAVKVCDDLPWPLDELCGLVMKLVKVVVTLVVTIVKWVVQLVCYTITLVLKLAAAVFQILGWLKGLGMWIVSQVGGLLDAAAGLLGILPIKHLRLHVIILMRDDRTLTVPPDRIGLAVQRTESIFRSRAKVKIHTTVHQVTSPSPRGALYVDTGVGLLGEDLTEAGLYYRSVIMTKLPTYFGQFTVGIGTPIVAFVVDGVGDSAIGCSAGPLADYVCVEGATLIVPGLSQGVPSTPVRAPVPPQPAGATPDMAMATLAHELGHACGLLHDNFLGLDDDDPSNLMYSSPWTSAGVLRGDNLSPFQRAIVRSSPHVTYI